VTSMHVAMNSFYGRAPGAQLNYDARGKKQEVVEIDSAQIKN